MDVVDVPLSAATRAVASAVIWFRSRLALISLSGVLTTLTLGHVFRGAQCFEAER